MEHEQKNIVEDKYHDLEKKVAEVTNALIEDR